MKAKDMMIRDLTSVTETTTLREVENLLYHSRLSGVPVVDNESKVIGYISEKDIIESAFPGAGMGAGMLFVHNWAQTFLRLSQAGEGLVKDYMTKDPICVTEDENDAMVVEIMLSGHRKVLPVVRDEKLVGVITRSNLCRVLMKKENK